MNERSAEFETLVMSLSQSVCPRTVEEIWAQADSVLGSIGSFLRTDFVAIALLPETGTDFQWMFLGSGVPNELAEGLGSDSFRAWTAARLEHARIVRLPDVTATGVGIDMDPDPFAGADVRSLYVMPLSARGEVFGALLTGTCGRVLDLPEAELRRGQCLGQVVGYRWVRTDRIERLSDAIDAAESGLWSVNLNTMTYWSTPSAKAMHGFRPDEVVSLDMLLSHVHAEDRWRLVEANALAAREPGSKLRIEYRVEQPDGTYRWMLARGSSDGGPDGPVRITGIVGDITIRKTAEEELLNARAVTDAVFDSVPGIIYLYSKEGKLVRWNKQHEIVSGYSAAELRGFDIKRWFSVDDTTKWNKDWRRVFESGKHSTELGLTRKDGTRVPCLFTGVRVDINGQPHMVGIGIDITEKKRAETDLAELRKELAHATRMTALGELASALAHELNQPLAAILSNAQAARRLLAADPPDLEEVGCALEDIVRDDKRAGEIVHGMRAMMARGEAPSETLDMNRIVASVASLLKGEAAAANVPLELDLAESLPPVHAGRTEMQQVLLNLMMNAIDAQRATPVAERVLKAETRLAGDDVVVAVCDAGRGFQADQAEKIFEPFFTTKDTGLGMGLAISRRIVEHYGGRIWARTNPARGVTFFVTLPGKGA